ncbi:hypothetical protein INT45_009255 [Circinella minor]|uniref:Uncharacterized protein n=1 Tax=Circinella minor TaxID=1195481 RepID=A0A8H7RIT2_9FUNG|nr:hypothetical protein INT45_009255 [Circinella minor]
MEQMPPTQHSSPSDLHPITVQSSGCTVSPINQTTRMEDCSQLLQEVESLVGSPPSRPVCHQHQHPATSLCQLEMGSNSNSNRCNDNPMGTTGQDLHLCSLESDSFHPDENTARTNISNNNNTTMAISNMVSNSQTTSSTTPNYTITISSSSSCGTGSKRPRQEPTLETNGLEYKLRHLNLAGANFDTINIILHPDRICTRQQQHTTQQHFIEWFNYLAYGRHVFNWATSTILAYRSAIIDLFNNKQSIINSCLYQLFIQSINEGTLRPSTDIDINLQPIFDHFNNLNNNTMTPTQLTHKVCWLFGVCGMMRPSDIDCIDLDQCHLTNDNPPSLLVMVVAPKEKRSGQQITHSVILKPHTDQHFCPISAYTSYRRRIAHQNCFRPHPALSHITINKFIQIMTLLPPSATSNNRRIKAHALGSSRAVQAGASVDDNIAHGSWSSAAIFNNFYRLSNETHTDFTTLVLGQPMVGDALDTQLVEPQLDE